MCLKKLKHICNGKKLVWKLCLRTSQEKKSDVTSSGRQKEDLYSGESSGRKISATGENYFRRHMLRPYFENGPISYLSTYCGNTSQQESQPLNFVEPVLLGSFHKRVAEGGICLKNVLFRDYGILGSVVTKRDGNLQGESCGKVQVRYTTDNWQSGYVLNGTYENCTSKTCTFSFKIDLTDQTELKVKVEFFICYETSVASYWDDNLSKNYQVQWCRKFLPEEVSH